MAATIVYPTLRDGPAGPPRVRLGRISSLSKRVLVTRKFDSMIRRRLTGTTDRATRKTASDCLRNLHLIVKVVGDEVAHDLVEVLVGLEAKRAGAFGIDTLGPAIADLLDRRIVLPGHLANLAVAGMAADRLLELAGRDV